MKCESCTKYDDCRTGSGLTWPCGAYRPNTGCGMDIENLIEDLRIACAGNQHNIMGVAAIALSTLQAENEKMQKQLNEFSEFLCHMTGGLLSKTNYTSQEMISAAEDYQQRVCGECDLRAENEKLRAELDDLKVKWDKYQPREHWETLNELCENLRDELEQVKRERDAAVDCIYQIEDDLNRGKDNDWAREHIAEWESQKED